MVTRSRENTYSHPNLNLMEENNILPLDGEVVGSRDSQVLIRTRKWRGFWKRIIDDGPQVPKELGVILVLKVSGVTEK